MVSESLFQTQNFSTLMFIDGAIGRYVTPEITLAFFVIFVRLLQNLKIEIIVVISIKHTTVQIPFWL